MIVRDGAPAHQRRHHRNIDDLGKRHEKIRRVGIDDAAARHDQRAFGSVEHFKRFLDLLARCGRLVDGKRLIGLVVEFDLGELHIERQVDQHRAGAPGAHDVKCLTEDPRHKRRFADGNCPLRNRLGDRLDVDGLEIFLVDAGAGSLSGDAQDRDRIRDS